MISLDKIREWDALIANLSLSDNNVMNHMMAPYRMAMTEMISVIKVLGDVMAETSSGNKQQKCCSGGCGCKDKRSTEDSDEHPQCSHGCGD